MKTISKHADFYIGAPIWAFKGWVGNFFPEGTKPSDYLYEYSRRLNTVEGNTTFYAVPARSTLQHWVEQTPTTFRFCPKIPRDISHAGKLMDHLKEALLFKEVMSELGDRLGPFFLQLPPVYAPSRVADLREFLDAWPTEARLAVEVRHLSWFDALHHQALQTMLADHHMARVTIDTRPIRSLGGEKILQGSVYERLLQARERKPDVPIVPEPTAYFTFLRYIGHPRMDQNEPFLDEWAGRLADWNQNGLENYVFCHCPDERADPLICRELHRRVSEKVPVSPLGPQKTTVDPTQARLF